MVDYGLMVPVVAFLVVAMVAFHILKGVFKTMVFLAAIVSIATAASVVLVFLDVRELRENLEDEQIIFLLTEGTDVLTAIVLDPDEDPEILHQQEIDEYSRNLEDGDLKAIKGEYYKVIVIDTVIFEDVEIPENIEVDGPAKALFYVPAMEKVLEDPVFLLTEYKKGNIQIYEETTVFKVAKYIPITLVKKVVNSVVDKGKATVEEKVS